MPDAGPVWGGFTQEALDAAYNNTAAVPHAAETLARLSALSAETRQRHGVLIDAPYGDSERQRFDLLACGAPDRPLLVFIHGGYWQRNHKDMFTAVADGLLAAGWDASFVGYTLAPEATLTAIVAECETAVRRIRSVAPAHGVAARRIVVSGWSAGGHLAARLLEMPEVDAALAISGLFDLEPIRLSYINDKLRLTAAEAENESPMRRPGSHGKPITVAVGERELPELRRQSFAYAEQLRREDAPVAFAPIEGADHFSILDILRESPQLFLPGDR
jgi:arylformamidase